MDALNLYIYEVKKGTKPMALITCERDKTKEIINKLNKNSISSFVQKLENEKDNIFFGNDACIKVVKHIANKSLSLLSPQEDFILGIMLGYSRVEQCQRYCQKALSALAV